MARRHFTGRHRAVRLLPRRDIRRMALLSARARQGLAGVHAARKHNQTGPWRGLQLLREFFELLQAELPSI